MGSKLANMNSGPHDFRPKSGCIPGPKALFTEMMIHKEIDHNAAHLQLGNQFLHLVSSIMMNVVYVLMFTHPLKYAAMITIAAQTLRQGGHFFIEGNATSKEKLKIGYTTRMKQYAVYGFIPLVFSVWHFGDFRSTIDGWSLAFLCYGILISFRVVFLCLKGDHCVQGLVWLTKIVTDTITDIHLYGPTVWGYTTPKTYE